MRLAKIVLYLLPRGPGRFRRRFQRLAMFAVRIVLELLCVPNVKRSLVVRRSKTNRAEVDFFLNKIVPIPMGFAILWKMLNGFVDWQMQLPYDSVSGQITTAFYAGLGEDYAIWIAVALFISVFGPRAYALLDKLVFGINLAPSIRVYRYIFVLSAFPLLVIPPSPFFETAPGFDTMADAGVPLAVSEIFILGIPVALYAYYRSLYKTGSLWRNIGCLLFIACCQNLFAYSVMVASSIAATLSLGPDGG